MLARRLGKTRIIAETGAGQHGVATATACARFGLECVVFMGSEDMRRQAPNVERMHLLGATVVPVEFGTRTLKEATSEAIRDWITNVETTHYVIGSCVGPAPYPELVARAAGGRGARSRASRSSTRRGPAPRCGDRLRRRRLERDRDVRGVRDDAGSSSSASRRRARRASARGRAGVLHGARSSVLADEDGQVADAHSISAGLDYPGVGPEHAFLRDSGRARYVAAHGRRGARGVPPARAHRRDHPRARVGARARRVDDLDAELIVVCLSGRGDKDLAEAWRRSRPGIVSKALVIYLMAGADTPALAQAAVEGGADIVELGFPFSDPLADGPVIRAAG